LANTDGSCKVINRVHSRYEFGKGSQVADVPLDEFNIARKIRREPRTVDLLTQIVENDYRVSHV
jgi:hypothetical protein